MIINFNTETYGKLKFLSARQGRSVAAYVAALMDAHADQLVNISYSVNEVSDEVRLIPEPGPEAYDNMNEDGYSMVEGIRAPQVFGSRYHEEDRY